MDKTVLFASEGYKQPVVQIHHLVQLCIHTKIFKCTLLTSPNLFIPMTLCIPEIE